MFLKKYLNVNVSLTLISEMFSVLRCITLATKPCSVQTMRRISVTAPQMKNIKFSDLQPDSDVILVSGKDDDQKTVMKYSEALEKVKQMSSLIVTKPTFI